MADYVYFRESYEVSNAITQQGIASVIGIRIEYVSRAIKRLKEDGYVSVRSSHIIGMNRNKKAYFLTAKGIEHSKEIKNWFNNQLLLVRSLGGELIETDLFQLNKFLNYKIKPLEVFKYASASKEGIIDLKQIISNIKQIDPTFEIKQDYTEIVSLSKKDFIFPNNILNIEDFFGRIEELNQLRSWLENKNLYHFIIIHGIAGIGKTTLISKLIGEYKGYKHIFWHNFSKWDSVRKILLDITEFMSKLDDDYFKPHINFNKPLDLDKILELLKKNMKNLNAILIFDDFHKANKDVRNFFALMIEEFEELANIKFIFLSRYNIPFYDQQKLLVKNSVAELELEGLDFESSIKILHRKGLPKYIYKEIVEKTAGNPLLLEIFESSKKTKRYIYEEIFLQLTEEEQKIMETLSTYRTPVSFDAFFINDNFLPETINNLTRKLIIKETSDGFYNTHEFIKEFVYKQLNPHAKRRYHESCGEYYIKQKEPINYSEALYHYINSQQYQIAVDLAVENAQNIINQGLSERFLAVLEELTEDKVSLPQFANILMLKGKLCFLIGDWDKSLKYYHRAIEVSIIINGENIKAQAYYKIGYILEEQNLFDRSLKNFQKSLKISEKIRDFKIFAVAKRGIGRYYWRNSDYTKADKYFRECINAIKNIKDLKLLGSTYIDFGNIFCEQFKTTQAIKYYEHALKILKKVDNKTESVRAYNNLATLFCCDKRFKDAIKYFKKQLKLAEEIKDIIACCTRAV